MPGAQKEGSHKKYGPKMAHPRIRVSKEKRGCGPLGRYIRWKLWLEAPWKFKRPTVKPKLGR